MTRLSTLGRCNSSYNIVKFHQQEIKLCVTLNYFSTYCNPFQTQISRRIKFFIKSPQLPNWIYNGMVTIYTENGDSIDIILCGECGATGGGGRESREDQTHWVVKDFCQGKVQFHSIYKHQNQSYHLLPEMLCTKFFCLWHNLSWAIWG